MEKTTPAPAGLSVADVQGLASGYAREFGDLVARCAQGFKRKASVAVFAQVLIGLMSELPRINCWAMAEARGYLTPDKVQNMFSRTVWDEAVVAGELRDYVIENLGTKNTVLVIDETGDVKSGKSTVGVARQYTGTAGKVENATVVVHGTWATDRGAAFIGARVYVPEEWTSDRVRMATGGIPDDVTFKTKPQLAIELIEELLSHGHRPTWVAADSPYGRSPEFRDYLQAQGLAHVVQIACTDVLTTPGGPLVAGSISQDQGICWQRLSAGEGVNGPRWSDWAGVDLTSQGEGVCMLLARRSITPTPAKKSAPRAPKKPKAGVPAPVTWVQADGQVWEVFTRRRRGPKEPDPQPEPEHEITYYLAWSPKPVPLWKLVEVAGARWKVEEDFQQGKELAALDEYQVRKWRSVNRWILSSMLALAFLTAITSRAQPSRQGLALLTRNEIRRILTRLAWAPVHTTDHMVAWVNWRLRRRHAAITSHRRRTTDQNKPP